MTETERTALLSACSFAKVFIDAADREMRASSVGASFPTKYAEESRKQAAKQLQAALKIIEEE